ncbi:MAG: hypothetical protein O3B13_22350 [Planctomycetota bacterium]|nr:hypothetical protein [Planctomycetota bacterium]
MTHLRRYEVCGEQSGYDSSKKVSGRQRHVSLPLAVTGANQDDGIAAPQLLSQVTIDELPRLTVTFGDNKYTITF